ncbi:hypothetical protein D9613_005166 [Agrocybe pediades]|uniref:Uncharacterized protein n=1 Tax=Agrocybe pediades TaxID=84607 RepID=A0A8H4VR41_9AGAR|nr:hypothetical protein D9613_005166 [Agrocybe pediades]
MTSHVLSSSSLRPDKVMLSLWRSRTGLREADKTVVKVIHITWESAVLPSICMVVAVGLYHAAPVRAFANILMSAITHGGVFRQRIGDHLVLFFVLLTGKFYTFGMLRTLNSRQNLRLSMQSHGLGRTSLGDWDWDQATLRMANERKQSAASTSELMGTPGPSGERNRDAGKEQTFASSVDVNTPSMDTLEAGKFRQRVLFGDDGEGIEETGEIARRGTPDIAHGTAQL